MTIEKKVPEVVDTHAGTKFIVTKDHTIEDILKAHKEKYSIHFSGNKDDFLELSDEDLDKLPKTLMIYYITALKESQGKLGEVVKTIAEANTPGRQLGYNRRIAPPNEQLEVKMKVKGMVPAWVRAYDNETRYMERKGYVPVHGNQAETFANDGSKSGHYVGDEKNPEMVLYMISEDNYKLNQKLIKQSSENYKKAVKEGFAEAIEATGLPGAHAEIKEE